MRELHNSFCQKEIKMSSDKDNYVHGKVRIGAALFVCQILLSPGFADGNEMKFIFCSFLFAVVYGLFSKDIMLSAIFGFLFLFAFPLRLILTIALFFHDVPPTSEIPYFLIYGLLCALLSVISAWIARSKI